jgi:hypothetical protein
MKTLPITLEESKRLIELEKTIEAGKQIFIKVGIALAEIRDARLYKADFKTFEDYCTHKWGWTRQHCYRLIECAPVAKCNPQITSINQARELAKVPKEQREVVIKSAVAKSQSESRKLTAQDIKAAAVPETEPITTTGEDGKVRCPRAKTKRELIGWYFRTTKEKRAQFLNFILTSGPVEVEDKAKFKQCVDWWFEHLVKEAAR